MKKRYTLAFLLLSAATLHAQQEPMQTQFFFNKLAHNPAYAGSERTPEVTAVYRNQWMGVEGAPNTQTLSYNQPIFNERVGVGANLSRYSMGITRALTLDMVYCYRIHTRKGTAGIGIQAGARHFYQNWSDQRLITDVPRSSDGSIPDGANSKVMANFGAGFYFRGERMYVGVAGQRLYGNNIDFSERGATISREVLHLNAMTGWTFLLDRDWKLIPQVLLKYAPGAPFDADFNSLVVWKDRFFGGATYRLGSGVTARAGESVDVLLGMQATEKLFFCFSYDIGLTPLRQHSNGTVEATLRYRFNPPAPDEAEPTSPVDFLNGVDKKTKRKKQ